MSAAGRSKQRRCAAHLPPPRGRSCCAGAGINQLLCSCALLGAEAPAATIQGKKDESRKMKTAQWFGTKARLCRADGGHLGMQLAAAAPDWCCLSCNQLVCCPCFAGCACDGRPRAAGHRPTGETVC